MAKVRSLTLITAMAVIFSAPLLGRAQSSSIEKEEIIEEKVIITKVLEDGTIITEEGNLEDFDESGMPKRNKRSEEVLTPDSQKMRPFMIGLELGTGLDVSGYDLSTFNADILFGYRHKIIQLLGVQVGVHKSLGSRDSFIPISVVFRTSFRPKPSLLFFHINAGYSFNTVASSPMFGDITAAIGCGFNLVQRPKFQSNIIIGFGFRHFNHRHQQLASIPEKNVGYAQISLGISM